jgi:peptide/nickel transport system ATP-binding protein
MTGHPAQPLLTVEDLAVRFEGPAGPVQAVRSVSLSLSARACLGLVGESGSGKSVTARSLVGLAGPAARVSAARLHFEGEDLPPARALASCCRMR